MALTPGVRLGPYEIVAALGAGGMGEVYRGRDSKLDREVAIKVLPDRFGEAPEALARFEREAKAVAALSHPNILAIHDFGKANGVVFAVMELLEGESLAERLAGGPLPVRKTVEYAVQIAHGLAAAHDKGIVHRDIKPGNIFVTRDGRVKILDFGLAKQALVRSVEPDTPTVALETEPGTILGTVSYMSPEQVRGQSAGARSDIFSFGAVLYEMLCGRLAFGRETAAETMTAILREDPLSFAESGRQIPPALERTVRHCLEKNPLERFQSARDLAFDLETAAGVSHPSGTGLAPSPALPPVSRPRRWILAAALGAVLLAAGVFGGVFVARSRWKTAPPLFKRLTFARGTIETARFSPASGIVVYGARWQGAPSEIYSSHLASPESRPLGIVNASLLSISASEELALQRGPHLWNGLSQGTLARAPLGGGGVRDIKEGIQDADWLADSGELALLRLTNDHWFVEFPQGKVVYDSDRYLDRLRARRDGSAVAFFEAEASWKNPMQSESPGAICVLDRAGKKTVLGRYSNCTGLAWSPSGGEVWVSETGAGGFTTLWALTLSGQARLVWRGAGLLALEDIASDGRVLAILEHAQAGILALAPGARAERDLSWLDGSAVADISADGRTVIVYEGGSGGGEGGSFYSRATDGSPAVRLGEGWGLSLSADGRSVLAFSATGEITRVPTGAGEARAVKVEGLEEVDGGWFFPDGQRILLMARAPKQVSRFHIASADGGKTKAIAPEGFTVYAGQQPLSHDGTLVAGATTLETGIRFEVYPVAGGAGRVLSGLEVEDIPIGWTADDRGLYFFNRDQLPARVYRYDLATGRKELWREFMPADPAGISGLLSIVMTPDGSSYAYNYVRRLSELYLIEGLR